MWMPRLGAAGVMQPWPTEKGNLPRIHIWKAERLNGTWREFYRNQALTMNMFIGKSASWTVAEERECEKERIESGFYERRGNIAAPSWGHGQDQSFSVPRPLIGRPYGNGLRRL